MTNQRLREKRLAMVRRFDDSELSRVDFCRREGVSVSCFDYWRAKVRGVESPDEFIEVRVEDSQPVRATRVRKPSLEVDLPMGVKLRFFEGGR